MEKYDVFISCKSEDYKYAEEIYEFLTQNGVNTFLASREIRKLGESEYRKSITRALKDAEHMIIFASDADYIDSEWVAYEWDLFITAKLKGFKSGNIVTILHGVANEEINMELWKYESMTLDNYRTGLLNYVETEQSRLRLKKINEERERLKIEELETERQRIELEKNRKELQNIAQEYAKSLAALDPMVARINALLKKINIENRVCPVCAHPNALPDRYCGECGATLSPLLNVPGAEYLLESDTTQIQLLKERYNNRQSTQDASTQSYNSAKADSADDSLRHCNSDNKPSDDSVDYYTRLKADVGIVYRDVDYLYFCLPATGRKLKINIKYIYDSYEPLREIGNITLGQYTRKETSEHPAFDFGLSFAKKVSYNLHVSAVLIIAMPNYDSYKKALHLKRLFKDKHTRILLAPTLCALGDSIDGINTLDGESRIKTICGEFEVDTNAGDGVLTIDDLRYSSIHHPLDEQSLVRGILTNYLTTQGYIKNVVMLDCLGFNFTVTCNNKKLTLSAGTTLPAKIHDDFNISAGTIITAYINSVKVESATALRSYNDLEITVDNDRIIKITATDSSHRKTDLITL